MGQRQRDGRAISQECMEDETNRSGAESRASGQGFGSTYPFRDCPHFKQIHGASTGFAPLVQVPPLTAWASPDTRARALSASSQPLAQVPLRVLF